MLRPDMETVAPVEMLKTRVANPPEIVARPVAGPAMLMLLLMVIGPEKPDKVMVEKLVMSNVSPGTELATRARNVPGPESAKLVTTNVPGVRNIWSSPFTDPPPFV